MVYLGETHDEVVQVMDDLRSVDVDFITIGQYLQPSVKHYPLSRYYHPDEFKKLELIAKSKGFISFFISINKIFLSCRCRFC